MNLLSLPLTSIKDFKLQTFISFLLSRLVKPFNLSKQMDGSRAERKSENLLEGVEGPWGLTIRSFVQSFARHLPLTDQPDVA